MFKKNIGPLLIMITVLIGSITSCGPTRESLKKNIKTLEKEVARLKTEKVNIEARSASLDDRLIVLKKRLKRCKEQNPPSLKVVRLIPGGDTESDARESPYGDSRASEAQAITTVRVDGKRPRLVLHGRPARSPGWSSNVASKTSELSSEDFADLAPDNLGIVPLQAGHKSAFDSDPIMDAFHAAYRFYSNKQHDRALQAFEDFLRDHPKHEYADNALYWRGECFLAKKELFKGIGEFERLLRRFPQSEKSPLALYRIGFAYDELRDRARALEYYFRVVDDFPNTDAARRASRRVAAIEGKNIEARRPMPTASTR